MKLVKAGGQFELAGSLEKLADTIALWRAEEWGYSNEMFAPMAQADWRAEVPAEVGIDLVRGTGFELLNDDGTPVSPDTVIRLGQRVWEKLQEMAEMELEEEELPPGTQGWP